MIDHVAHIQRGDWVTIRDRFGREQRGKVNPLLIFREHVILNIGNNGTFADNHNIVRCSGCKRK